MDSRVAGIGTMPPRRCRDARAHAFLASTFQRYAVDWSLVSAVELSGAEAVYVSGQLMRVAQNPDARHYANFHLYFPDTRLTRSVASLW